MNDILILVEEIKNQPLYPIDLLLFAHKQEIVMEVVKVSFQEVTVTLILSQLTDVPLELFWFAHPFETASWTALAHCPTIKIICIQVLKVMTLFPRIELFIHVLIVPLHVLMICLGNATSCASLKH